MDAREDAAKEDAAAEASASETTGGTVAGLQPVGQEGGVDFGEHGSTGLRGVDLLPQGLLQPAGGAAGFDSSPLDLGGAGSTRLRPRARGHRMRASGDRGHGHATVGAPVPAAGGELGSPDQPERPLLGMEHVGVAGADQWAPLPAPAGSHGAEQNPGDFQFRPVGGGGVVAMRVAALLAMFVAAMALIGEQDASWRNQFRTIMFWLGGCIGLFRWILFLSRH